LMVNGYTSGSQLVFDLAIEPNGDFVVVWQGGANQDGQSYGVFGQRFSSAGAALGGNFQANTTTVGAQRAPMVAMDADGNFVVVWYSPDNSSDGIFGQRYSSDGTKVGVEFMINTVTANQQRSPSVAMADDG